MPPKTEQGQGDDGAPDVQQGATPGQGYKSNEFGKVHPIILGKYHQAAAGLVTGSDDNLSRLKVRVHSALRSAGIHPRGVHLTRPITVGTRTVRKSTFLPICDPAAWEKLKIGDTVTINTKNWTVESKVDETVH